MDLNETVKEAVLEEAVLDSDTEDDGHLFAGSQVGIIEAFVMILQFVLKHHLSSKAFAELLLLLRVLLPRNSQLPKSVYMLKRFFLGMFLDMKVVEHRYCTDCHLPVQSERCSNPYCSDAKVKRFITIPLRPQLKRMMAGK